jgi:hypothetical protein
MEIVKEVPFWARLLKIAVCLSFLLTSTLAANVSFAEDDDILMLVVPALVKARQSRPKPNPAGEITVEQQGTRLIVSSSKAPTWKVEFAVGSGAPGGGTAVAVHIPADDSRSIVEPRPFKGCCSGLGLDNIEWRWRPWGGFAGTRGSAAYTSNVSQFEIIQNTSQKLVFRIQGDWEGISYFDRTTTVTPDGFTTSLRADYAGTPGQDSMWWIMALFHPDKINGDKVMVSDDDTSPVRLHYTPGAYRPLPPNIRLPYNFHFPLTASGLNPIKFRLTHMAEGQGNPNGYEFFDQGHEVGNYYLVYPRWLGSFQNITYNFEWNWRFTPEQR